MIKKVPYIDLPGQYAARETEIRAALDRVLRSGTYIQGEEVIRFESDFARLAETAHAVGVSNGTDALILALMALDIGPGDEVITAANSWISSASSIALVGATPVFADVGPDYNLDPESVAKAITPDTKAIMPVHLTGLCADMDPLQKLADYHGLAVIEDAAQAVCSSYRGSKAGSMGIMACFSLHPLKNLNAVGDAGIITTNDKSLDQRLRLLRNHGQASRNEVTCFGHNARLDALQAAVLNVKIPHVNEVIQQRRAHAARYRAGLEGIVDLPLDDPHRFHTYHLFVIQCRRRDELKAYLKEHGISSAIHYPIPIHLQPACSHLAYRPGSLPVTEAQASRILSLPVHHMLGDDQIDFVIEQIRAFYKECDSR